MQKLIATIHRLPKSLALLTMLSLLALSVFVPTTAFAASAQQAAPQTCGNNVACIIAFGNAQILMRQASLAKLSANVTTLQNTKRLTADQASVLQATVSTNQTDLANLKTKLDAETNAQAARQDVIDIYEQLRIYIVVLPVSYRQIHLDIERNVHDKMVDIEPALQQAISKAPASEQAQLNTLFIDYKKNLTTVESLVDVAMTYFPQLTPANYNQNPIGYKTTLQNLSTDEQSAHSDLHQAASDLQQIMQILKGNK
jgi:hypothetical protein